MKKLIQLVPVLLVLVLSGCSKDDDQPTIYVNPNLLATPATLENNEPLIILDATAGTSSCASGAIPHPVENSIVIDKEGKISDASKVTIEVNLAHTWCGDLVVELIAPDGSNCTLIKRLGSTSDISCGTGGIFVDGNIFRFNSTFDTQINIVDLQNGTVQGGNVAPSSGTSTFPIAASILSLEAFLTDKNIKGTWKLRIADYGLGDTGSLIDWKLKFDPGSIN